MQFIQWETFHCLSSDHTSTAAGLVFILQHPSVREQTWFLSQNEKDRLFYSSFSPSNPARVLSLDGCQGMWRKTVSREPIFMCVVKQFRLRLAYITNGLLGRMLPLIRRLCLQNRLPQLEALPVFLLIHCLCVPNPPSEMSVRL